MRTSSSVNTQTIIDSPLGPITLVNSDGVLAGVFMVEHRHRPDPATFGTVTADGFEQATEEFEEYFAGDRRQFTLITATQGTAFQRRVWEQLCAIPYGETRSYAELAEQLGGRSLSRAVGAANGRNPLSVVVPCHRLIGSDGSLTDYGGGLERKRQLLILEGVLPSEESACPPGCGQNSDPAPVWPSA